MHTYIFFIRVNIFQVGDGVVGGLGLGGGLGLLGLGLLRTA
jgi:hypothetical protein